MLKETATLTTDQERDRSRDRSRDNDRDRDRDKDGNRYRGGDSKQLIIIADFLSAIELKGNGLNLDSCVQVSDQLSTLSPFPYLPNLPHIFINLTFKNVNNLSLFHSF